MSVFTRRASEAETSAVTVAGTVDCERFTRRAGADLSEESRRKKERKGLRPCLAATLSRVRSETIHCTLAVVSVFLVRPSPSHAERAARPGTSSKHGA